jgi:hypothetical protein
MGESSPRGADQPLAAIGDLWRRSGTPSAGLTQLTDADAFPSRAEVRPP